MRRVYILLLFGLISILDLYQVWSGGQRLLTKPLIMLVLMGYYLDEIKNWNITKDHLFLSALGCAWLGDVFLLKDDYFLLGLGAFLLMQGLYTWVFWRKRNMIAGSYLYGLLFIFIILGITISLWENLGDMLLPVVIYILAISLMSFAAFARDRDLLGYKRVFLGTLFFIISDGVLAIHQFTDHHLGKLTVMSTYIIAQWLIVEGYIREQLGET